MFIDDDTIMKSSILIFSLFISFQCFSQSAGKKYTFRDIGWTIALPEDFTAFPSADASIEIHPGQASDTSLSKRLIMAMSDANVFSLIISSCNIHDEKNDNSFILGNKQAFKALAKGGQFQLDSATTTISIDGVPFRKFRVTTRKNDLIHSNEVLLQTCYKGYSIYITLLYYNKKAGDELESILEHSKFTR